MTRVLRLLAVAAALVLAGALAACSDNGGSDAVADLPDGVIARVGDANIPKSELDSLIEQQRASAEANGQSFPEEGTPEFERVQRGLVEQLVLQRVVAFEARKCGRPCRVTNQQVNREIQRIIDTTFNGSQQEFDERLAESKLTMDDVRRLVRFDLQQRRLVNFVTRSVRFTAKDAREYYDSHRQEFTVPAGRTIRHILVSTKAEADRIRRTLTDANFAEVARRESIDTASAPEGGDLGQVARGTLVPEFEEVAFKLGDGEISQPVQTQFGWHIIQAKLTKERVRPFSEVRSSIIQSQLTERRNAKFVEFRTRVLAEWEKRTVYADPIYAPERSTTAPTAPTAPTTTTTAPTTTAPTTTAPTETAPPVTSP